MLALPAGCGGGGGLILKVTGRSETEPNDSIGQANPYALPPILPGVDYVGFEAIGSVSPTLDSGDYFSFAADRSHDFTIALCDDFVCFANIQRETVDVSNAYFEVLDQGGVQLFTTRDDMVSGYSREMFVDAGVVYYIAVHAEDKLATTQSYTLSVVEKPPFD